MLAAAQTQGVGIFGVADHFCRYPDGTPHPAAVAPESLENYLAEARACRELPQGPVVAGIEADWFPGHGEILESLLGPLPFDFRIGSVHHVDGECIDAGADFWAVRTPEERDRVFDRYWQLVAEMAQSGLFDIAAHLDLPKKFGFKPRRSMGQTVARALDALADHRMVVELNTAGWRMPCAEAYPAPEILRACRKRGIRVTIAADAHQPGHLLFGYERAVETLADAGFDSLVYFRERQPCTTPLD